LHLKASASNILQLLPYIWDGARCEMTNMVTGQKLPDVPECREHVCRELFDFEI